MKQSQDSKGNTSAPDRKVMRLKQLITYVGLSRSTIYDLMDAKSKRFDPTFPQSFPLSAGSVVWWVDEVDAWLDAKAKAYREKAA